MSEKIRQKKRTKEKSNSQPTKRVEKKADGKNAPTRRLDKAGSGMGKP